MSRPVTVQFLKNPNIIHWGFEASWLGEDQYGDWIALPVGSKRWKGAVEVRPTRTPAVFCVPRDEWWHLHYNGSHAPNYSHFVDIVTPPVWVSENRYEMIDLDLDVGFTIDGQVVIEDEDEFEVHQVKYEYTDHMIERAVSETKRVTEMLVLQQEPFFDVAESWLSKMR